MKKIIAVIVFVLVAAADGFGQTDAVLNLNRYVEYFGFQGGRINPNNDYVIAATRTDRRYFSVLDGSETVLDTPLEFALLSYYSQPVLNIRPAQADAILPANNPKLADQKLGAAVFQEMQILHFLGDTAAVGRHEAVLSFITGRGNATRVEIETYYRNGIRGLIAGIVDEEFRERIVPVTTVTYVKQSLANFFITPNQANFNTLKNIYDSTNGNLDYVQQMYDTDMSNLETAQSIGATNLVNQYRRSAATAQNTLNTARRQINAPNDSPIDWGGFRSGYTRILNGLNTELVRRIR
jgi:hypothetical protein